jgi:F-type H+-transporting ATPase subunit alpha
VGDQVVQVFAATEGFLDRLLMERVGDFLLELTERIHAQHRDLGERIAGGEWSDEVQAELQKAVKSFAEDYGYDLDEEGQPLDEEPPPVATPARPLEQRETEEPAAEPAAA